MPDDANTFTLGNLAFVGVTVLITAIVAATFVHRLAELAVGDRVLTLPQLLVATGLVAVVFLLWSMIL